MKTLKITTERLGEVQEVIHYLQAVKACYDNIWAFDLIVDDAKIRYEEDISYSYRPRGKTARSLRRVRDASLVVLPEERISLRSISITSPGFWEFAGSLNPLEVIRQYLTDRHERKKDLDYRNRLEAERLRLENEKLKTDIVRDRIDILHRLEIPEDRIRDALTRHLVNPLEDLDAIQDVALIRDAAIVEVDDEIGDLKIR